MDRVRDVDIWEELQQEGGLDVLKEQQGIRKMKVLRRVEGVSRLDRVRDVDIWEELQQ